MRSWSCCASKRKTLMFSGKRCTINPLWCWPNLMPVKTTIATRLSERSQHHATRLWRRSMQVRLPGIRHMPCTRISDPVALSQEERVPRGFGAARQMLLTCDRLWTSSVELAKTASPSTITLTGLSVLASRASLPGISCRGFPANGPHFVMSLCSRYRPTINRRRLKEAVSYIMSRLAPFPPVEMPILFP